MIKKYLTGALFLLYYLSVTGQTPNNKNRTPNKGALIKTTSITNTDFMFDPSFHAKTISILSTKESQHTPIPLALVRNLNGKLGLMAKDSSGKLWPFYMRGIETGFWDTRKDSTDYEKVFETFHKLGANAAMFMIHWSDIEPQDGRFDFSFTDKIVATAERHGVKIVWILFMHEHSFDMKCLSPAEKLWMYNLDSRDGANYAIQWIKDKNGNIIKDIPTQKQKFTEIVPCY